MIFILYPPGMASRLTSLPPLHALRAFDAAARFGRFREAAAALGISESAVSHQVKQLETFLGVSLFQRSGNAVSLTPTGAQYFDAIDPAFTRIREATEEIRGPSERSRVSLTLGATLATLWLIPRLQKLETLHPEVSLQLVTTERICDLRREQIHLGIRYGQAPWAGVVAEHLLDEQAFPVCAPGYADPSLGAQEVMRRSRLIVNDTATTEWQAWAKAHGLKPPATRGSIVLHASDQVLGAALEGLGLAIGRRPLVNRWLDEGRLVAPFGAADLSGAAYFLVYPEDTELPVGARKVARWLRGIAAAEAGSKAPRESAA
jgi:LysR family glycine cleavage system transcriptional activator